MLSIVLTVVFFFGCEAMAFTSKNQENQIEKKETQIDLPSSAFKQSVNSKQEQLEDSEDKKNEQKKQEAPKKQEVQKKQEAPKKQEQQESKGVAFNGSYYTAKCKGCSGITATGVDVRKTIYYNGMRVIAVDPSVIPLYSIVQVTTPHETFKAIALDKGGAIKGHKVDILVADTQNAIKLGRHTVYIKVLRSGK